MAKLGNGTERIENDEGTENRTRQDFEEKKLRTNCTERTETEFNFMRA